MIHFVIGIAPRQASYAELGPCQFPLLRTLFTGVTHP